MEYVAVFALAAIVAIIFNWVQPKVIANASTKSLQANYFGKTLLTTVVIFAAIIAAGVIFSLADRRVSV